MIKRTTPVTRRRATKVAPEVNTQDVNPVLEEVTAIIDKPISSDEVVETTPDEIEPKILFEETFVTFKISKKEKKKAKKKEKKLKEKKKEKAKKEKAKAKKKAKKEKKAKSKKKKSAKKKK